MSKKAGPRTRHRKPVAVAAAAAATAEAAPSQVDVHPPFKPRPRLFFSILALVALWVIGLLALYATTVYPNRSSTQEAEGENSTRDPQRAVAR